MAKKNLLRINLNIYSLWKNAKLYLIYLPHDDIYVSDENYDDLEKSWLKQQ